MPQTSDVHGTVRDAAAPASAFESSTPRSTRPDDQQLVEAVRGLVEHVLASPDETHLAGDRVLLDVAVDGFRCLLLAPRPSVAPLHTLSPREQEIVRMVAQGYPNKTIAAVLDISSWTVSTYLRRIFAKLDVRSRAAMVAKVLEDELLAQPAGSDDASPRSRP